MDCARRRESEKAEHGMVRMDCAGRGNEKGRTGNGNDRTRNDSLPLTVLISRRDLILKTNNFLTDPYPDMYIWVGGS
jgi:hypothetical protein